ncbi:hypothetical protein A6J66_021395 [Yersinia enterocolitica]|nr:hypothetical protein A6J66_021395 [Yersinia enterocolitica]
MQKRVRRSSHFYCRKDAGSKEKGLTKIYPIAFQMQGGNKQRQELDMGMGMGMDRVNRSSPLKLER